ncbi:dCMP deaminase [Erwinia phage pEa_SNUABM_7]|uniref:CMP/dCMP-type deaminase domain-containing protein n=1 Tax=Erwinia phage pEa_SNUABM_7 TaxID=2866695 RepID=A0AAE8BKI9_9CAUD|nr:dCMP deaminase [Erwinia phage pEa_SNUABM_7]QYW04705.1 hypothetical protein pEaSNUABM7_00037 [Erwinia phage pEa_SNUABM_7]
MRCNLTELPIKLDQAENIMGSVFALAAGSKSKRRATAAMLIHFHEGYPTIISSGVNGTVPGESNVCENEDLTLTFAHVTHAEANCLNRMDEYSLWPEEEDILFCTDSPCPDCLQQLESAGVQTIIYAREYRLTEHLDKSAIRMYCLDIENVRASLLKSVNRIDEVIATIPT